MLVFFLSYVVDDFIFVDCLRYAVVDKSYMLFIILFLLSYVVYCLKYFVDKILRC